MNTVGSVPDYNMPECLVYSVHTARVEMSQP